MLATPQSLEHESGLDEGVALAAADGLAVVIGHTKLSPGAPGLSPPFPPGTSEYGWNTDLARRILLFAEQQGIRCKVFTRDVGGIRGAYRRVARFNPQATVELHFNSYKKPVRGTETLYGKRDSERWATALQRRMVALYGRRKSDKTDRGIKLLKCPNSQGKCDRGYRSVTQLHPSALIEPFFGHVFDDAKLGNEKKQELAEAVVHAYADLVGTSLPDAPRLPDHFPDRPCRDHIELSDYPLLNDLREVYRDIDIEFPSLKTITLAQWALESGWGHSDLARLHFNFGGMKAIAEVQRILDEIPAEKVWYEANDGPDFYLRFPSLEGFIKGYWMFMERSPYTGWRDHARRSPEDFIRFIGRKWATARGYADTVIDIKNRLEAQDQGLCPGESGSGGEFDDSIIPTNATLFRQLIAEYRPPLPELADRKLVLLAQWALESNWGRSALAVAHRNFAGIQWQDQLADVATRERHPSAPEKGYFCRFLGIEQFFIGYAAKLQRDPTLAGWQAETGSDEALLRFLGSRWLPSDTAYYDKLKGLHRRFTGGQRPRTPTEDIDLDGFVLHVERTKEERRGGKRRTVGRYQAYYNRRPIGGLRGMTFEPRGLGDNTRSGINKRRIEPGRYPLATHGGTKYKTYGYRQSERHQDKPRPGIAVGETESRSYILVHPGNGFLSSTGCINLSKPLAGPGGDMSYPDSRRRVIDLIDGMREKLGGDFPRTNNKKIPRCWLLIEGEPRASHSLVSDTEDAKAADMTPDDLFEQLAATISKPDSKAFTAAIAAPLVGQAVGLDALRNEWEMNLWDPWAESWEASAGFDHDLRTTAQDSLRSVAKQLSDAGVAINDTAGLHSPLVAAAASDAVNAVAALIEQGADPELYDNSGMTPLLAAAFYGAEKAFRYLFFNGVDATATSREPTLSEDLEDLIAEHCPPGSTVRDCAEYGRTMVLGGPDRMRPFDAIL